MDKNIFLIAFLLVFYSGFSDAENDVESNKDDPEMQILIDNISDLASKVLNIFEPMAAKASNDSAEVDDNTYFVSFLLRDRKNKTMKQDLKQRMIVNNNFNGEKLGTSQVFVESGPPPKQSPSHNIQLLNNPVNPSQGYPPQAYKQPYSHQQQNGLNYG